MNQTGILSNNDIITYRTNLKEKFSTYNLISPVNFVLSIPPNVNWPCKEDTLSNHKLKIPFGVELEDIA